VRDDEDTDRASFFSSASTKRAATSNPVWSAISRKPVGLVTLISVTQSPITSSPTSSSPRSASRGPMTAAISLCRGLSGCASPRAPAARLPRHSPAFGMRARQ
jgi:hypothetical protein